MGSPRGCYEGPPRSMLGTLRGNAELRSATFRVCCIEICIKVSSTIPGNNRDFYGFSVRKPHERLSVFSGVVLKCSRSSLWEEPTDRKSVV